MTKQILIGGGLAFAAAVQPGPLQAYLLSRVASIGWRRTLPAAFAPLLSDGPIALLALLVLGRLSPGAQNVLRAAGGALLLFLAARAFRQWRRKEDLVPRRGDRTPRTLFEAALVNLLNPNPYLGWALILGPAVMTAWRESPGQGAAVVVAFYSVMVSMLALSILAFGSASLLGPRFQRALLFLSVLILGGLGAYQSAMAARFFGAG
ncbi:MAG: LysE family transporter [Candidatus Eisenbacteria bacterium]|nr:LysE family transporter [Candidatus Eisenbacteria bacterium]